MKKGILTVLALLVFLASAASWYYFLQDPSKGIVYELQEAKRANVESVVIATGLLEPANTVVVGTEFSGQISELYADFNNSVVGLIDGSVVFRGGGRVIWLLSSSFRLE